MNETTNCQATGKTRYPNRTVALSALERMKSKPRSYQNGKRVNRRAGKPVLKRIYHCKLCMGYHFTKQEYHSRQDIIKERNKEKSKREGFVLSKEQAADWKKDSIPFPELKNLTHEELHKSLKNPGTY